MRKLFDLGLIQPASLLALALSSAMVGLCNAGMLYLINQSMHGADDEYGLPAFIALFLLAVTLQELNSRKAITHSQRFLSKHREHLIHKVLSARFDVAEHLQLATFAAALSQDSNLLAQVLPGLINGLVAAITIATVLASLGFISPVALFFCLGLMALGAFNYMFVSRRAFALLRQSYAYQDRMIDLFEAMLNAIAHFKQSRRDRENILLPEFAADNRLCRQAATAGQSLLNTASSSTYMLLFAVLGLVVFVLPGFDVIAKSDSGPILSGLLFLTMPISRLLSALSVLPASLVAAERSHKLLTDLEAVREPDPPLANRHSFADWTTIEIDQVAYRHRKGGFQMEPVSLTIKRGETVFITGENGAGKTTFGKILTGLYPPDSGVIRVDDTKVTFENVTDYCALFSIIHKNQYIADRLARADDERFPHLPLAASKLGYPDTSLPDLQDQPLNCLSTGQKRRLLLFFSYLSKCPILFLDEWAADQDPEARAHFYSTVLGILKRSGVTVIVVTHDDKYFDHADRILRLGRSGVHSERLTSRPRKSAFRDLI